MASSAEPTREVLIEQIRFLRGEFFATTEEVWSFEYETYKKCHWEAFQRSPEQNLIEVSVRRPDDRSRLDPYKATRSGIDAEDTVLANFLTTRSESDKSSSAKKSIWPVDITGDRQFNPSSCHIAHLLPAGKVEHEEWFGVAAAVLGLGLDTSTEEKLMATRGVSKKLESKSNNQDDGEKTKSKSDDGEGEKAKSMPLESATSPPIKKTRFDVQECAEEKPDETKNARLSHTGVVHFVTNKIRMKAHAYMLDGKSPVILLVPCMTLEDAKSWRGSGYKAAVLAGCPLNPDHEEGDNARPPDAAMEAYQDVGFAKGKFYERYVEARKGGQLMETQEQTAKLEKARLFLKDVVLGLAQYIKSLEDTDLEILQSVNQIKLKERSQNLRDQIAVPKWKSDPSKPVLFVDFGPQTGGDGARHPAPDPLLLSAKAASVWGTMTGYELLASAEPTDEGENDSLDELAEEAWLAARESQSGPIPVTITVPRESVLPVPTDSAFEPGQIGAF